MVDSGISYKKLHREYDHMIRLAKKLRADGRVSGPLSIFVVAYPVKGLADARIDHSSDPAVQQLRDKIRAYADEQTFDGGEDVPNGVTPEDWVETKREYERICEEAIAETFKEYGESQMLSFYRNNRLQFDMLYKIGRAEAFGEDD